MYYYGHSQSKLRNVLKYKRWDYISITGHYNKCVEIYEIKNVHLEKNNFSQLKVLVSSEGIILLVNGLRKLIYK